MTLADDLAFPEGPIAMADGSVIVVEIAGPRLTRIGPDGSTEVITEWGDPASAGPNGAAIGPDGAVYVCNNGGFLWSEINGMRFPIDRATGSNQAPEYVTGSIDRVEVTTGEITTLYTECDGHHLCGPNDIVFDSTGGFWFTDLGKQRVRELDKGAVYYARPDGSSITRCIDNVDHPNGCGLSPDGSTLYVAQTTTGRVWAYDITAPGELASQRGTCIANTLGNLDSMAVEADGTVVVAALRKGLLVVRPNHSHDFVDTPDQPLVTNVAFGGPDRQTAFITESAIGRLLATPWPRAGLELTYNA